MKKLKKTCVVSFALLCAMTTLQSSNIFASQVYIDSKPVVATVEPYVSNGYTLVPLRTISENLGAEVSYDATTRTVTAIRSNTTIELTIGQYKAKVNGEYMVLDTTPEIKDGTTMVPLRFIATAFGCKVNYNPQTKNVSITTTGTLSDVTKTPSNNKETSSETVASVDAWGNKIRTTNLPANAEHFPYIREDMPNWVYTNLANAWKDNYIGWQDNPKQPFELRKVLDDPKTLWNNGKDASFWDSTNFINPSNGKNMSIKKAVNNTLNAYWNVDYRNITDVYNDNITLYSQEFLTTLQKRTKKENSIEGASYAKYAKDNELVITSDIKPLYECSWTAYNGGNMIMYLPVYANISLDHIKAGSHYNGFGDFMTNGANYTSDMVQTGDKLEGVILTKLIYDPSIKRWQFSYYDLEFVLQLEPSANTLAGANCVLSNPNAGFCYAGMKEKTYATRYEVIKENDPRLIDN